MKLWATSRRYRNGIVRLSWRRGRNLLMQVYLPPGTEYSAAQAIMDDKGEVFRMVGDTVTGARFEPWEEREPWQGPPWLAPSRRERAPI